MSVTIEIPVELERRLRSRAQASGETLDEFLVPALEALAEDAATDSPLSEGELAVSHDELARFSAAAWRGIPRADRRRGDATTFSTADDLTDDQREAVRQRFLARLRRGRDFGSEPYPSREVLYAGRNRGFQ